MSETNPPYRPFLVLYVVWHPDNPEGEAIAAAMRDHFRRNLFNDVAGGLGIEVHYRSEVPPGAEAPLAIPFVESETTAVVVLLDEALTAAPAWVAYAKAAIAQAEGLGLGARVYPVAQSNAALAAFGSPTQAFRMGGWTEDGAGRRARLITGLTFEFARMLRHYLEHLRRPATSDDELDKFLEPVSVFLSHSKHDDHGVAIADAIRDVLNDGGELSAFFDAIKIPPGVNFADVLRSYLRRSALIGIQTDSYASREWCRREVIEAKRHGRPIVVVNCIADTEERSFPYMGNVPVVRMDPVARDRLDLVVARLMDEVLRDFLWACRVERAKATAAGADGVAFVGRPPELLALAHLGACDTVVYPDPPLGEEEVSLFGAVRPDLKLQSMGGWLAEQGT